MKPTAKPPGLLSFSNMVTGMPFFDNSYAVVRPVNPAPIIAISWDFIYLSY